MHPLAVLCEWAQQHVEELIEIREELQQGGQPKHSGRTPN